jgi:putative FmdB family regulatory protein
MPIFDYRCLRCGFQFESIALRKKDRVSCPDCGSLRTEKNKVSLFHCTGVQLTKRLRMESEEQLKKGGEILEKGNLRKDRIKIF